MSEARRPVAGEKIAEEDTSEGLSRNERRDAERRAGPRVPVMFASIAVRGRDELERPLMSLFGSGVSAGLVIMLSLIAEGILTAVLPEFDGKEAVTDFGYTIGFAIVILGRMQLFTENTITPVLPLLAKPSRRALWRTARLWGLVFAGNIVGTFVAALTLRYAGIVTDKHLTGIIAVAEAAASPTPAEHLRLGVPAGFAIAALVWCLPAMSGGELLLILLVTYVVALGDFAHVVVGSGEIFLVTLNGSMAWSEAIARIAASFAGNVLGGTLLFAFLAYAQVREEMFIEKRHAALRSKKNDRD